MMAIRLTSIEKARRLFQVFFLSSATYLLVKVLMGLSTRTVEYYCPMGGVVSLYGLFRKQQFICALTETNLTLAVALLVAVVLTKRSFCSWVCPLGAIFEALSGLRGRLLKRSFMRIPDKVDGILSKLKYVVLAVILLLSYQTSELVFRGYDPFYILFTGARGHGLIPVLSVGVLIGVLVLTFLFEMAWCRYLCPLAAAMDPLSRVGLLKVRRSPDHCSGCGVCDRVCPQRIPVSRIAKVVRSDCTNCLRCVSRCGETGALDLGA